MITKCDYCNKLINKHPYQLKQAHVFCSIKHQGLWNVKNRKIKFWSHVKKGDPKECWIWQASKGIFGYGQYITKPAHRASYTFTYGKIPKGMYVLHKCDNPPCVNPNHLELGTQRKNINDCSKRGRINRGEDRPQHKLTEKQVLEIRSKYKPIKGMYNLLAKEYSVNDRAIYSIVHRQRWKHI